MHTYIYYMYMYLLTPYTPIWWNNFLLGRIEQLIIQKSWNLAAIALCSLVCRLYTRQLIGDFCAADILIIAQQLLPILWISYYVNQKYINGIESTFWSAYALMACENRECVCVCLCVCFFDSLFNYFFKILF